MVQSRDGLRSLVKTAKSLRIACKFRREDLNGNIAIEAAITGSIS
jgi:hypothetical protein